MMSQVNIRLLLEGIMRLVEDIISMAIRFARLTSPDKFNLLPTMGGATAVDDLYDPDIYGVTLENKIAMALEIEKWP